MLGRLRHAIERRHDVLIDIAGLNQDAFDALQLLAAGDRTPGALTRGHQAAELSAPHTRDFMSARAVSQV
ncbi:hypothetical protein [Actinoplanes siamensis]|uniref:Uncharacterized protein n=1 Tax=Actinoplanes siamensis TaxID=1223317 RepID=A0A919THK7_9ACTN|nr:hypothetical protein [Actinoplanes siamensis]GIF03966.1 hypothetical protein Asi03nite_15040 [Actinoplanes siamensis]